MNYNGKTKKCFDKLIEANTTQEIIDIIDNSGITLNTIKAGVTNYCIVNKKLEFENILKEKISIYTKHLSEIRKKENNKHEYIVACNTIRDFLRQNTTIENYCKTNNIKINIFKKYVKLISIIDINLYNEFNKLNKDSISKNNNMSKDSIYIICDLLKKGITENDNTRKMDIIDYYEYCNLSFENLINYAYKMRLNSEKKELIRKFIIANRNYDKENKTDIRQILSEKVILGDGYVVEKEFKLSIIEKLKEKNIPVNRKTYTLMFRRCINEYRKNLKAKIK